MAQTQSSEQAVFTTSGAASVRIQLSVNGVPTIDQMMNLDAANPGPYYSQSYTYAGAVGTSATTQWTITPYTGPNLTGTAGPSLSASGSVAR